MDIESTKTVVFGIGGAGCKIIQRMSENPPKSAELIALDNDRAQLNSMSDNVKKVFVNEALEKKCDTFEEIHQALNEKINSIEDSLEGVGMAVVIVGLGGKTGGCIGNFIGDLCERKNIFTLFIPIFPLKKVNGNLKEIESIIKKFRDRSGGVIIIDNNMWRRDGKIPMLQVFERANTLIINLTKTLVDSVSYRELTNLDITELMQFFYGDYYFIVGSGQGSTLKNANERAMGAIKAYADRTDVKKLLAILSRRSEVGISEMKELNSAIQGELEPETIKWINTHLKGIESSVLLVCAVKELPLIEGVILPDHIGSNAPKPNKAETAQTQLPKAEFPATKTLSSKEIEEPSPAVGVSSVDFPEADLPKKVVIEPEEGEATVLPTQINLKQDDEENFLDESMDSLWGFKSPALIGLDIKQKKDKEVKKSEPEPAKEIEDEGDDEEGDLDDIINEISGFPSFKTKKKGQKKLDEYDGWGIDYI